MFEGRNSLARREDEENEQEGRASKRSRMSPMSLHRREGSHQASNIKQSVAVETDRAANNGRLPSFQVTNEPAASSSYSAAVRRTSEMLHPTEATPGTLPGTNENVASTPQGQGDDEESAEEKSLDEHQQQTQLKNPENGSEEDPWKASNVVAKTKPARGVSKTFPGKLHELLSNGDVQDTVCWLPDGDSFAIKSRDRFMKEVSPLYFKEAKFDSFTRKLNRWGFRRISSDVYPDDAVYFHKLFQRDSPELSKDMRGSHKKQDKQAGGIFALRVPGEIRGIDIGNQALISEAAPLIVPRPQVLPFDRTMVLPQRSPLHPVLSPLETRLLEEQMIAENTRLQRIHVLKAEIEARHQALSLLHPPMRASALSQTDAMARYFSLTGGAASGFGGHGVVDGLDAQAMMLLRQHQADINSRFFRQANDSFSEFNNEPQPDESHSSSSTFGRERLGYSSR